MVLILRIIKGEDEGGLFQLREGKPNVVGRGSTCDVILRDVTVSRRHAEIRLEEGGGYVRDLGSRNGTYINGRPIEGEARLADRDLLDLGRLRTEVRIQPETSELPFEAPPLDSGVAVSQSAQETLTMSGAAQRLRLRQEPADLIGSVIGGCCVERYLGEEGVVQVYRAIQVSMERAVALKLLLPELAPDKGTVERFMAAARIGGRLSHPNIIQVYDAGEEREIRFVVLEYVGNATLRDYLGRDGKEHPLDQFLAAQIAAQLAAALDYAHSQGFVHGRVTPSHILLTSHGVPKLADLGAMSPRTGSAEKRPPPTLEELCYLAPEEMDGSSPADPRGDLYSLGVVLYAMLAGRPGVEGESAEEIIGKVRKGERTALSRLRRDVSRLLAQVVTRALSAKPEDRYARASEMEAALLKAQERL